MMGRPNGATSERKVRKCACGKDYEYGHPKKECCDACKCKKTAEASARWRRKNPDYMKNYIAGLTEDEKTERRQYMKSYNMLKKG
jgi:hypothetical protein